MAELPAETCVSLTVDNRTVRTVANQIKERQQRHREVQLAEEHLQQNNYYWLHGSVSSDKQV